MIGKYIKELLKWDGYIEKASNSQLDHKTANAGNKNYTRFGRDFFTHTGANLQAQPWCMIYLNSVLVETIGLVDAKKGIIWRTIRILREWLMCLKLTKLFLRLRKSEILLFLRIAKAKLLMLG